MRNFARSVIGTVVAVALTSLPVNANTQTDDFRQQLVLAGDTSQIAKWDALTDAERAEFVAFLNIQVDEQEMMGSASEGTTLVKVPSRLRILPPVDGGGATQWTSTFERAWSYLGITYTSLKLTFVYVVQADQVTTSLSCVPSFTNYVPMRSFSAQPSGYVQGGKGTCTAMWSITRDNWWTTSGEQGMRTNATGIEAVWSS